MLKKCVLVSKTARHEMSRMIDYLGFEIPDVWVVGYGLDYDNRFRTLPYIGVFDDAWPSWGRAATLAAVPGDRSLSTDRNAASISRGTHLVAFLSVSSDDFDRYKIKIQNLLKRDQLTIEEVLESFSPKHQNRVLKVIEYLLDEQILKKDDEKLILL